MKAIKLVLIFALILGGVVGALYLLGAFHPGIDVDDDPPPTFEEFQKQITNGWKERGDWDKDFFLKNVSIIQQLKDDGEDTESLTLLNTKTAVSFVNDKIFAEWRNPSCKKSVIDKYIGAIKIIESKDGNASSYADVKLIKSVNSSYAVAYAFASKNIGLKPSFNGSSWANFSSYSNQVQAQKKSILNNGNYKNYLSNISSIKNALNSVDKKLTSARKSFYEALATQIYSHYARIDHSSRTAAMADKLSSTIERYEKEYKSNGKLNNLMDEYNEDTF